MSSLEEPQSQIKDSNSEASNFKKLFLLPLILLFFIFALQDVLLYIIEFILAIFYLTYPNLRLQLMSDSNQLFLILFLNAILDLLPLIILGILIHFRLFKLNSQKKQKQFGFKHVASIYIAVSGAAFGISLILLLLASAFGLNVQSSYVSIELTPQNSTFLNIFLLFILTCVIAPVFEETVFRRQLIPTLEASGYGTFSSVLLSSFLFGLAHSANDIENGNALYAIDHLVITTSLGIGLGIVFITTRDIRWNIILHGFFNFYPSFVTQIALLNSGTTASNLTPNDITLVLSLISLLFFVQIIAGSILAIWFLVHRETKITPFFKQFFSPSKDSNSRIRFYLSIALLISLYVGYFIVWSIIRDVNLRSMLVALEGSLGANFFIFLINSFILLLLVFILFKNRKNLQSIWNVINPDIKIPIAQPYQSFIMPTSYISNFVSQNEPLQVPPNSIYPVQKFCGYCGASIDPGLNPKFCPNCGKPLLGSKP